MLNFRKVFSGLLAAGLIASCAGRPAPRVVVSLPEKNSVYQDLALRATLVRGLRAQGVLQFRSPLSRSRDRIALLVRSPLDLRIESLLEFGAAGYEAVSLGGEFSIFWPLAGEYFRGIGTRDEMQRYLSFPLAPEEAIPLILSAVPLEPEADYRLEEKKGRVWLRGLRSDIEVEEADGRYRPVEVVWRSLEGAATHRVRYGDFTEVSGISFPHFIEGRFSKSRVLLVLEEVELNPPLETGLFELDIPENAHRIY